MLRHCGSRYVRIRRRLKRCARRCRNAQVFLNVSSNGTSGKKIYLELYPSPESGLVQPFSGERYRVTKENLYLSVPVLFILCASFAPRDGSESDDVYDDTDYCHYTHHSEQCLERSFSISAFIFRLSFICSEAKPSTESNDPFRSTVTLSTCSMWST